MNLAKTRKQEVRSVLRRVTKSRRGNKVKSRKEEVLKAITMKGTFSFKEVTVAASDIDEIARERNTELAKKYGNAITRDEHGNILICKSIANSIRFFVLVKGINEVVPVVNNKSLENAFRRGNVRGDARGNAGKSSVMSGIGSVKELRVVKPIRR